MQDRSMHQDQKHMNNLMCIQSFEARIEGLRKENVHETAMLLLCVCSVFLLKYHMTNFYENSMDIVSLEATQHPSFKFLLFVNF